MGLVVAFLFFYVFSYGIGLFFVDPDRAQGGRRYRLLALWALAPAAALLLGFVLLFYYGADT